MEKTAHFTQITLALCLPIFIACIDVMALSIGLSSIMQELHADIKLGQWLFLSYMLASSATLILAGQLSDKFNANRVLLAGISLFTFSSIIAGFSFNFYLLAGVRAMQGIACSIITTSSITTIKRNFLSKESTILYSRWVSAVGLGLSLGPLIGAIAITQLNWRYIFFINIPIGITSIIYLKKYIPNVEIQQKISFTLLIKAIPFKNNILIAAIIGSFFSYFFMYAWLYIYSLYLQNTINLTPMLSSILTIPYSISFAYSPLLANKALHKVRTVNLLKIGLFISIISFFLLYKNINNQPSLIYLSFVVALLGTSISIINFSTIKLYTDIVPSNATGIASGILFTLRWLGGAVGVYFITTLIVMINSKNSLPLKAIFYKNNHGSISIAFLILGFLGIFTLIATYILSSKNQEFRYKTNEASS